MKLETKIALDLEEFFSEQMKFIVGDSLKFKMKDGEKVKARAVQETANGNMLFIFEDCLKKMYSMEEILNKGVMKKIYKRIPKKIRKMMIPFDNGRYLRLPTEKEMFGRNKIGKKEDCDVKQFSSMKNNRHRIAFIGYKTNMLGLYWLSNKCECDTECFAVINGIGDADFIESYISNGVRPVFCMKNSVSSQMD